MSNLRQSGGKPPRASSFTSLGGSSTGGSTPAPNGFPRTPERTLMSTGGSTRPLSARSSHSGSATPTASDEFDAHSLSMSAVSGATSFSSAADATLFAPASTEDAVHAVPSLLSLLLSGRTDEQVLAARKLHAYCRHSGRPVEAAIAAAGGVHMLLIMLDSLDRNLRDLCTRVLTDLASDDSVRAEILSAPGGTAKVIQLMYRGILDGQASAGHFLELLATSKEEAVQAALSHSKVVRMLCDTLGAAPSLRARGAALSALQAFCRQDPGNLRKLAWSGGCDSLLGLLQSAEATPAQHASALQLLAAAVALQPDAAGVLRTPQAVASMARFVGAPEASLAVQAEAADLLSAVAAAPVKREGVQQALTDLVLPRCLEIVHEAAACWISTGEHSVAPGGGAADVATGGADAEVAGDGAVQRRRLQASCAAVVAQLVQQDRECCHSILFHAQLLGPAVRMLVQGGRYRAAQQLLAAARSYATSLAPSSGSGGTALLPSVTAAGGSESSGEAAAMTA